VTTIQDVINELHQLANRSPRGIKTPFVKMNVDDDGNWRPERGYIDIDIEFRLMDRNTHRFDEVSDPVVEVTL
jgi:hypothetical protein